MPYEWDVNSLEQEHSDWLEENCKCPISEHPCECLDFNEWFECKLEDAAENHEDYCA